MRKQGINEREAEPDRLQLKHLDQRFCALWNRCLSNGFCSNAKSIYQQVSSCYSEPHRAYHTLDHLGHALQQLDLVSNRLGDPDALEMALWFHDIVYKPGSPTNELESAMLFANSANHCLPPNFVRSVYELILATTHSDTPQFPDAAYISDIDLSSLGLPWERFRRDSNAVRKEQAHLPDDIAYLKQVRFLRSLVARPRIFFSNFFFFRYEHHARRNIDRFLVTLADKLDIRASIFSEVAFG